jgi:RHH-type proline utilization regulon transcriptional repressor/proline dehydrogenase/delta 1-pyrroline-5-carboxylate dehydrogenase
MDPALTPPLRRSELLQAITAATRRAETELLPGLLAQATMVPAQAAQATALALRIARGVRDRARDGGRAGLVQGLLQEFALSSAEGVALMCLAEALLRIPDAATRDALIRDKIGDGDWQQHLGHSPSIFVNAAAWGLLLTGRLVATHSDRGLAATLSRVVARGGEPLIRRGVDMAMRMMGEQFVTGETIAEALVNARAREATGFRYSYDMLGEAALTAPMPALPRGLRAGHRRHRRRRPVAAASIAGPGISIKLSALHPRYARAQLDRVMDELYPRLRRWPARAPPRHRPQHRRRGVRPPGAVARAAGAPVRFEPALAGWNGLGFVIQAYQKRCPAVVDWIDRPGAAQRPPPDGAPGQGRLLGQRDQARAARRPGRTTRSTRATAHRRRLHRLREEAAGRRPTRSSRSSPPTTRTRWRPSTRWPAGTWHAGQYEFQCLHGMGEPLYEQVVPMAADGKGCAGPAASTRRWAPTTPARLPGAALLENGANTSFVNRIADENMPLEALVEDPVQTVCALAAATRRARPARRTRRSRCRRAVRRGAPTRAGSTLPTSRRWTAAPRLCRRRRAALARRAAAGRRHRRQPLASRDQPRRSGDTVGRCAKRWWPTSCRALAAAAPPPAWAAVPPALRAAGWTPPPMRWKPPPNACCRCWCARPARPAPTRWPRCARRSTSCATTPPSAARLRQRHPPAAGPGGLHQPVELPAGHLHRPGGGGAGRRQRGAGQAGRADAAGRRRRGAAAARGRRAARRAAAAARARRDRGRALVADPRVQGVLFTGSTEVARLLQRTLAGRLNPRPAGAADRRDRRPERDGRRQLGAGRAGGGRHRDHLGLRQRRPALQRAARCCACRTSRRPRARDAARRMRELRSATRARWPPTSAR